MNECGAKRKQGTFFSSETLTCDLDEDHDRSEGTKHSGLDSNGERKVWGV